MLLPSSCMYAMASAPVTLSLKRIKNVPAGDERRRCSACGLFRNPKSFLGFVQPHKSVCRRRSSSPYDTKEPAMREEQRDCPQ